MPRKHQQPHNMNSRKDSDAEKFYPSLEQASMGIQIKLLFALSVAVLSLVACKRKGDGPVHTEMPGVQPQITIVYDRMWSIGSATDSTFMSVPADAKLQEDKFYMRFATAFQSEPACSGLSLFALDPPGGNSPSALRRLNPAAKDQWKLNVSFTPGQEKQAWSMGPMMKLTNSSGKGDAHSMAHTVCLIAKGSGGQVIE
jgi:hypothetical protein